MSDLATLCVFGVASAALFLIIVGFVAVIGTAIQQRLGGK